MYKAPPPMQNRGGLTTYFSTQKGEMRVDKCEVS